MGNVEAGKARSCNVVDFLPEDAARERADDANRMSAGESALSVQNDIGTTVPVAEENMGVVNEDSSCYPNVESSKEASPGPPASEDSPRLRTTRH